MSPLYKKIIVWLILLSFLAILFFSFASMAHEPDGSMSRDCPFSASGIAVCPQNIADVVAHHISAYQSFLQVTVPYGMLALLVSLLLTAFLIYTLRLFFPPPIRPVSDSSRSTAPPYASRYQKIIRWLSLLELSPSLP